MMASGLSTQLKTYLLALMTTVTCISLFWAIDKHHWALELQQDLVNEQAKSTQQQQQLESLAGELKQWRELEKKRQALRDKHQKALSSGQPQVIHTDADGVTTLATPSGGIKITGAPLEG